MVRFYNMYFYDVQSCRSDSALCAACKIPLTSLPKKVLHNRCETVDFCIHCGIIVEQSLSYFKSVYAVKQFFSQASIQSPIDILTEINWYLKVDLKLTHNKEINDKYDHVDMEHGDKEKYKTLVRNNTSYFSKYIEDYSVPYYIGIEIFKWLDDPISFIRSLSRNDVKLLNHNNEHRTFNKDYSDDMMWSLAMIDNLLVHYPTLVNLLNPYLFPEHIDHINPNLPYFHKFHNPNILKDKKYKGELLRKRVVDAMKKMDIIYAYKCMQSEDIKPILNKFNVLNTIDSIVLNKNTNNAFNYALTKLIPMGTDVHLHLLSYNEFIGKDIQNKLINHDLFEFNKFTKNSIYAQRKYDDLYKLTVRFEKETPLF